MICYNYLSSNFIKKSVIYLTGNYRCLYFCLKKSKQIQYRQRFFFCCHNVWGLGMAKRSLVWNEDKLQRFLKEGRGSGDLDNYKPWLTVQDFPSMGRATRIRGSKTWRIHHLFTDSQLKYFYLLEFENSVCDIKEHFPILDYQTIKDKDGLNFKLFTDKESKCPYVLCTTFLITIMNNDGKKKIIARGIKGASELAKRTTLDKLEIERRFWNEREADFRLVTNKDIPVQRARNIEWLHPALFDEQFHTYSTSELCELSVGLSERLSDCTKSIRNILSQFDKDYGIEAGVGLYLFKRLIAKKIVSIDMDKPINLNYNLSEMLLIKDNRIGVIENEALG